MQQTNKGLINNDVSLWLLQLGLRREIKSHNRWSAGYCWSLVDCNSDRGAQLEELSFEELVISDTCSDFLWRGLALALFNDELPAYRFNISSGNARLFVVCNEEAEFMSPFLITASQDEAASYMDGGEEDVFSISMPTAIQCWIEAFIARHGEPDMAIGKSKRRHHGKRKTHNRAEA